MDMTKIAILALFVLSCPAIMFGGIIAVSAFSLAAALIAEVAFGLEPCVLCVYQRFPFAAAILLGVAGLLLRKNARTASWIMGLCALTFLVNAVIAFYHTGVELKWWTSFVEGCAVPDLSGTPQTLLENILSAPTASCDEIPWADPLLGLSMANYNVLLCLVLFVVCAVSAVIIRRRDA